MVSVSESKVAFIASLRANEGGCDQSVMHCGHCKGDNKLIMFLGMFTS